jgi:hypothetical protein
MRAHLFALALIAAPLATVVTALPAAAEAAPTSPALPGGVTLKKLRQIVEGLGHKTTDGKDASYFEFMIQTDGLNIYLLAEQSESTQYIWIKSSLKDLNGTEDYKALMRANFDIQPAQLFFSDNNVLTVAIPVENRDIKPAVVERALTILIDGAVATQDLWLPKE